MTQVLLVVGALSLAVLAGTVIAIGLAEVWSLATMRPSEDFWKKRAKRIPDEDLDWAAPYPKELWPALRDDYTDQRPFLNDYDKEEWVA